MFSCYFLSRIGKVNLLKESDLPQAENGPGKNSRAVREGLASSPDPVLILSSVLSPPDLTQGNATNLLRRKQGDGGGPGCSWCGFQCQGPVIHIHHINSSYFLLFEVHQSSNTKQQGHRKVVLSNWAYQKSSTFLQKTQGVHPTFFSRKASDVSKVHHRHIARQQNVLQQPLTIAF